MTALLWLAFAIAGLFAALDRYIGADGKKRLHQFLLARPDALDNTPRAAAYVFTRIFGEAHFSFRCAAASTIASLLFLALMYCVRMYLVVSAYPSANAYEVSHYVAHEISYPFSAAARASFAISLALNLLIDFVGLLKTRLIITFLAKRKISVSIVVAAIVVDLIASFVIFQALYLFLYFISVVMIFSAPQTIIMPAGDPNTVMPVIAEIMILLHFMTSPDYSAGATMEFIRQSHVIAIFLAFTFVPIFLTSVFYYASIGPSIWLWLFLFASIVSRLLASTWPTALDFLDFEKSPLTVLGGIAAALFLLFATLILSVYEFWWTLVALFL
jgi:hypothetical protein